MLKRTFHDLIEIKNEIAKLEKSKSAESNKKRRRIITISSSSEDEPTDTQSKGVERKDAPLSAATSSEMPGQSKSSARLTSHRKKSDAKASRGGNMDPTAPVPDSTTGADQPRSKKGKKKRSIKK